MLRGSESSVKPARAAVSTVISPDVNQEWSVKLFYQAAAEATLLLHFTWILFVMTGALFLRRRRRMRLVHLAAVCYSLAIEVVGWICPLTFLEQWLWQQAGRLAYEDAFITHYLEKLIYLQAPQGLLVVLAALLLVVTLFLYFGPPSKGKRNVEPKSSY